jgi:hypothetical protein
LLARTGDGVLLDAGTCCRRKRPGTALRAVMHTATLQEDLDPDRLSFIASLRVIRRQVIARPASSP